MKNTQVFKKWIEFIPFLQTFGKNSRKIYVSNGYGNLLVENWWIVFLTVYLCFPIFAVTHAWINSTEEGNLKLGCDAIYIQTEIFIIYLKNITLTNDCFRQYLDLLIFKEKWKESIEQCLLLLVHLISVYPNQYLQLPNFSKNLRLPIFLKFASALFIKKTTTARLRSHIKILPVQVYIFLIFLIYISLEFKKKA